MGVIKQGILGGFNGKVGTVIGASWKGISTMRAIPQSVANPNTPAQAAQRTKFRMIQLIASALLATIVKPFWDRFAVRQSGYNVFIATNIDQMTVAGRPTGGQFLVTKGSLQPVEQVMIENDPTGTTIDVEWVSNTGKSNALVTDKIGIVLWNYTKNEFGFSIGDVTRAATTKTITMPSAYVESNLILGWVFAYRPDFSLVSDSKFDDMPSA